MSCCWYFSLKWTWKFIYGMLSAATLFLMHWNAMAEVEEVTRGERGMLLHTASSVALHVLHLAVSKHAPGERTDGWPVKSEANSSFSSVTSKHNSGLAHGILELAEVMQLFWWLPSVLTPLKHQGMNYCLWSESRVEGLPYRKTSFLLKSHQKYMFKKKIRTYLIVCMCY